MRFSTRSETIRESATLSLSEKAKQLKASGNDVISFAVGEPDFDTPFIVSQRAKEALDHGDTRYVASSGILKLKEAISKKLKRDNELDYSTSEVVVTTGAKLAIFNIFQLLLDDKDEVIIPAPCWVSYVPQVRFAGGVPKIVQCGKEAGFKISAEQILKAATNKTKAIIINSPGNPTGAVYSSKELESIAKACKQADIAVISDEIYEKLVYDGMKHVSIASFTDMKELTFVVGGLSKSHAMTGWRVGYVASPKPFAEKMTALCGQQVTCVPPFVQAAAACAIENTESDVQKMRREFERRRNLLIAELKKVPGISFDVPNGAFYVWLDVKSFLKPKLKSSASLAEKLLSEEHLAVVPGEAFECGGYIRLSYALSDAVIKEGIKRLARALKSL